MPAVITHLLAVFFHTSTLKGLAHINAPTGTLIAYATTPGSVAADGKGRNGVYTEKLLIHIQTPGLTVEQMFKRVRCRCQQGYK